MRPSKKMWFLMLLGACVVMVQYHVSSTWLAGNSTSGTGSGLSYAEPVANEDLLQAAVDRLQLDNTIAASIGQKLLRDLVLQLGRELLATGACGESLSEPSYKLDPTPRLYIVTPTYRRPEQIPELTRMAQTLMHVPNLHWLVIEDAENKTQLVSDLLHRTGISHDHLVGMVAFLKNISSGVLKLSLRSQLSSVRSSPRRGILTVSSLREVPRKCRIMNYCRESSLAPMPESFKKRKGPKPRGVSNRNKGLDWIRANAKSGVLYFADDDNTYDIQLFEEIRTTKRVAMWPVGLCTKFGLSSPVVTNGTFVGFYDGWVAGRKFPVDMAGFAVSVEFLLQRPKASMPYKPGFEEDGFLKSLAPFEPKEIELKAKNCTEVSLVEVQTNLSSTIHNQSNTTVHRCRIFD
ncbi:hypothetical protein C0J52_21405 [Blattella germanica]|nr:hypothetical protein C0J52_21405 [Blattella germanica]